MAGRIPFKLANPNNYFKFNPIHTDDIALAIKHELDTRDSSKSSKFTLSGSSDY